MDARVELLVGDIIRRNALAVPGAAAASLGPRVLSHGELDALADRVATALALRGVAQGERVLAFTDTSLEVLVLFAALARLGAVFAPLDARLGFAEARVLAEVARPGFVVVASAHAPAAHEVASAVGARVAALGRLDDASDPDALLAVRVGEAAFTASDLRETEPHVMFFTSGSTARPKAVVLSHRASWLRSFQGVFRDEPERSVCMFPLFHMAGFTLALAAWQTRGEIALVPAASAEALLEAVERRRANRLYCIPSVWHRILDADAARFDTSSLRELDTGTSATPIELIRALKQRFPNRVTRIYYGSTEVGSAAALPDADVLRKPGSVGLPSPGVELRIEAGEICVRSAYLFDGYFEDPEATASALRDGWFHTGDLGELDAEGYLTVTGRLRDVIRTGGEGVAPVEIETALAQHPGVAEVAVVGVPDAQWGEIVCAVVVPAAGATPSLLELQRHCEGRLASFKKPRRLELVAALPRTAATGQIQRALLVQRLLATPSGSA